MSKMTSRQYSRAIEELQADFQNIMASLVVVNQSLDEYIKTGTTVSNRIKLKPVVDNWNKTARLVDDYNQKLSILQTNNNVVDAVEVELPFTTPIFKDAWAEWKDYLKEQHGVELSSRAEKRQLYFLKKYAGDREDYAIELIFYSMSRLYRMVYQYSEKELKGKVRQNSEDDGEY